MNIFRTRFAFATLLSLAPLAQAQLAETKSLTMEGARQVIAAAVAEANSKKTTGVIAVVDNGGNLMALERIDGTFAAGANISIGKARTALLFQKPTKVFEDIVNKGRTTMVALDGFTPLQGAFRSASAGRSSALWALAARRVRNKTRNWRSPAPTRSSPVHRPSVTSRRTRSTQRLPRAPCCSITATSTWFTPAGASNQECRKFTRRTPILFTSSTAQQLW